MAERRAEAAVALEVRLLGPFRLAKGGQPVAGPATPGA